MSRPLSKREFYHWLNGCTELPPRLRLRHDGDGWISAHHWSLCAYSEGCPRRDSTGGPIGTACEGGAVLGGYSSGDRGNDAVDKYGRWLEEYMRTGKRARKPAPPTTGGK